MSALKVEQLYRTVYGDVLGFCLNQFAVVDLEQLASCSCSTVLPASHCAGNILVNIVFLKKIGSVLTKHRFTLMHYTN